MATVALKIKLVESDRVKTLQFDTGMTLEAACQFVVQKTREGSEDFGLLLPDPEDDTRGKWLDDVRPLAYYDLKTGVRGFPAVTADPPVVSHLYSQASQTASILFYL
jgi:talin-like protein